MGNTAEIILTLLFAIAAGAGVGLFLRYYLRAQAAAGDAAKAAAQPPDREIELARIRARDRAEARALYERVVREKLDVIKTAITMGYNRQDIAELDARLEKLIGADRLQALLFEGGEKPGAGEKQSDAGELDALSGELLDTDLGRELERLKPRATER